MSAAPQARPAAVLPGALFPGAGGLHVLRLPLPPSLPIPLGLAAPEGVALVTWAFSGLGEGAAEEPVGLLVLSGAVTGPVTLATHFRDIAIQPAPAPAAELGAAERALVARALLSAGMAGAAALADALGLFGEALAALAPEPDAPRLAVAGAAWTLDGTAVPHGLVFETGEGWACARVAAARLGFAGGARIRLALEPLWGAAPDEAPRAAIALHAHGFTPLRVGLA